MAKINPNYKKDTIQVFTKNSNKGYVFKLKCRLSSEDICNLHKNLVKQLQAGILIYSEEILDLVDIYNLEIHEIVDLTEDKVII